MLGVGILVEVEDKGVVSGEKVVGGVGEVVGGEGEVVGGGGEVVGGEGVVGLGVHVM